MARSKVVEIEISQPISSIENLGGYTALWVYARLHGVPLGCLVLDVQDGRCEAARLRQTIIDQLTWPVLRHLAADRIAMGESISADLGRPHPAYGGPWPFVTVAVCTRDRSDDLARCLEALRAVDYEPMEIVIVDNAPRTDSTQRLVAMHTPYVRYVVEPRPGLNWARNRAILEARGEIIAYTDDDVVVDRGWVRALARVFAEHSEVMAVTGLVVPLELETDVQLLFERYGGFGRGYDRRWYRAAPGEPVARRHGGAGKFGTGANMAYRRELFSRIGGFDPALDVGTPTNGGGDLEMFFRVLKEGHTLVYEPAAIVRHRHRRDYRDLRTQLANNGIGFYSYLVRTGLAYPDERLALVHLGLWWFWWWNIRRLLRSFRWPTAFPRDLIVAELWGSLSGLARYRRSRRAAEEIVRTFGPQEQP